VLDVISCDIRFRLRAMMREEPIDEYYLSIAARRRHSRQSTPAFQLAIIALGDASPASIATAESTPLHRSSPHAGLCHTAISPVTTIAPPIIAAAVAGRVIGFELPLLNLIY